MNPLSLLSGLISPRQLLETIVQNLASEIGFSFTKMDFMFDKIHDRMHFEILLPPEFAYNPEDKDQFQVEDKGKILTFKKYAYLDKDTIKGAVLPLLGSLTNEQVTNLDTVDSVVLRFQRHDNVNQFDFVIASTVDGEKKCNVYPIN